MTHLLYLAANLKIFLLLLIMPMHVCLCEFCVHESRCPPKPEVLDPWSHSDCGPMWVLGTKLCPLKEQCALFTAPGMELSRGQREKEKEKENYKTDQFIWFPP